MSGNFVLKVRPNGAEQFGELTRNRYDDAGHKNEQRDAVLSEITGVRGRWQTNYQQYADAEFRIIEEFDEHGKKPVIVSGTKE